MKLTQQHCVPCQGGIPPLKGAALKIWFKQLGNGWKIVKQHHIEKDFTFKDFKTTLRFVNKVGTLAEKEGHHPNIEFTWGKAKIILYTHKINGLHGNDFIMAAKIDRLI